MSKNNKKEYDFHTEQLLTQLREGGNRNFRQTGILDMIRHPEERDESDYELLKYGIAQAIGVDTDEIRFSVEKVEGGNPLVIIENTRHMEEGKVPEDDKFVVEAYHRKRDDWLQTQIIHIIERGTELREQYENIDANKNVRKARAMTGNTYLDTEVHLRQLDTYNWRNRRRDLGVEIQKIQDRYERTIKGIQHSYGWLLDIPDKVLGITLRDQVKMNQPELDTTKGNETDEFWLEVQRLVNEGEYGMMQDGSPDEDLGGFFDYLRAQGLHTSEMTPEEIKTLYDYWLEAGPTDYGYIDPKEVKTPEQIPEKLSIESLINLAKNARNASVAKAARGSLHGRRRTYRGHKK